MNRLVHERRTLTALRPYAWLMALVLASLFRGLVRSLRGTSRAPLSRLHLFLYHRQDHALWPEPV